MTIVSKSAGFAAISFCAMFAMGSVPSTAAIRAPLSSLNVSEPLPPEPGFETSATDGVATDLAPELVPAITFSPRPRASSLAALVAHHASDATADREADCLAKAVYFESKGEPLEGQLAVAEVILNRAKSGRFAGTLCGVVKQPSQFSFVRGGAFPAIANQAMWRQAVGVAQVAMNGLWASSAQNALFFHARRVSPNWGKQRVAALGNHIFYR